MASTNPLITGNQGLQSSARADFPDPFLDMASMVMPRSLLDTLNMCESIWLKNGTYRMAASRIVRYFITKVEFEEMDPKKREKLLDFLTNRFHVIEQLMLIGDDFLGYGNSFTSVVLPFRRFLICSECRLIRPIEHTDWQFKSWKFMARCSRCRRVTEHQRIDRRSTEEDRIRLKRWAPQELRLNYHPHSQDYEYYWRIPQDYQQRVREGNPFHVRYTPWELLEAIRHDQLFKFNDGVVYHMCEKTLAGVRTGGWGISRLLSNFSQAWYTQVLKRSNEALAQDYVVPFRVITPAAGTSSNKADPLLHMPMPSFVNKVLEMVSHHRQDPATYNVLPFALDYQTLGGEAKSLATPELINQAMDELLNGMGVPAELYRGTLEFQAMPTALRMFQQTWPQLVTQFNTWLDWMLEIVCTAQSWDKPEKVYLQPVTMADDIEKRQIWLQLAAANMISKGTAFSPWGVDAADETRKIFREQRDFNRIQQEFSEDEQNRMLTDQYLQGQMPSGAAGAVSGLPGGPAPMMGGGAAGAPAASAMPSGASITPQDMMGQAQELAMQLVSMPYEQRRTQLSSIKASNQALHALVKQQMETIRSQASSQGRMMLQQPQPGM